MFINICAAVICVTWSSSRGWLLAFPSDVQSEPISMWQPPAAIYSHGRVAESSKPCAWKLL